LRLYGVIQLDAGLSILPASSARRVVAHLSANDNLFLVPVDGRVVLSPAAPGGTFPSGPAVQYRNHTVGNENFAGPPDRPGDALANRKYALDRQVPGSAP
jgi:hypothetical protein